MSKTEFAALFDLLQEKRLRPPSNGYRGLLIESESDKGRVVNSSAFRRLQQKAQVFPLEPNAAVRTRLTHSIEVSQVGRHLAQKVIEKVGSDIKDYGVLAALVNSIETACLLHDIGNPPFGHLGESAIKEWFKANQPQHIDLANFDGNPQGFRLISFLAGTDDFGFNLTSTLLLSTVKYPWDIGSRPKKAKIGIFTSDLQNYTSACTDLDWKPGQKFPFMQLMDTADEIAYSMSDLEDGLEKQIISIYDLKREFGEERFKKPESISPFLRFKTSIINDAVNLSADTFASHLDDIMNGKDTKLIDPRSDIGDLLKNIKSFAIENIYSHESAEKVELAGRSVIKGLFKHFGELLLLPEEDF